MGAINTFILQAQTSSCLPLSNFFFFFPPSALLFNLNRLYPCRGVPLLIHLFLCLAYTLSAMATASTSAFAPPQPRIAKSKSGSEPLFGKLKVYEHQDEQAAVEFLNQMLDLSIKKDSLHQELKDGVLLCT